jgi:hypothetical protein
MRVSSSQNAADIKGRAKAAKKTAGAKLDFQVGA